MGGSTSIYQSSRQSISNKIAQISRANCVNACVQAGIYTELNNDSILQNIIINTKLINVSTWKEEIIIDELYKLLPQNNPSYKQKLLVAKLRDWFKAIYEIVFGDEQGPRMGSFISFFGRKETIKLLDE